MYGIKVNVGTYEDPDWKWLHCHNMDRFEVETRESAEQQKDVWYPDYKAPLYKVEKIKEGE